MGEVHEHYLLCSQEERADLAVPHYHSPCLSGRTAPPYIPLSQHGYYDVDLVRPSSRPVRSYSIRS